MNYNRCFNSDANLAILLLDLALNDTTTIFSVTHSVTTHVSSRRSAHAQAAAGQLQFQQIANHCWLTAAAVVCVRRDKPNEYSWSRMFDLEQNLQHQSTCLNQNCREKSGSLYLN
jgi:hypothetical protein